MEGNVYFNSRFRASITNPALRSRESASELLGISESSLANYETGKTKIVPPEMVDKMASVYNAPELRNIYCVTTCPIGFGKILATEIPTIEGVAVRLANSFGSAGECVKRFMRIAEDGKIDRSKKGDLEELKEVFGKIGLVLSEFCLITERGESI